MVACTKWSKPRLDGNLCLYRKCKGIQGLPGGLPRSCTVGPKCYWQALFQVPKQSFVRDLGLPIGLRILRKGVGILDPILRTELLERFADELKPVVRDKQIRDPESAHDVPLHKLDELCCHDIHIGFLFCPLGEIINGHQYKLPLASS